MEGRMGSERLLLHSASMLQRLCLPRLALTLHNSYTTTHTYTGQGEERLLVVLLQGPEALSQ